MTTTPVPVRTDDATAATEQVRVTIAVPTFRRPDDLRAALPMLLAHAREVTARPGGPFRVDVLVVDNDPAGSGAPAVAELAAPDLRYVPEPTPGIAAVRNRAIVEAGGSRLLSFIDDDERPTAGWLAALVDTWAATGAAAVVGRMLTEFAGELDPWVEAGDFWFRSSRPTGTAMSVAACGNLLLDLDQVRALGLRFEPALAMGGGEDTLFSRALVRAGGRIVWCDESAAVDFVPRERMTRRWVLTRAWSHGNTSVVTDLRLTAGSGPRAAVRARGAGRGLVRVVGGLSRWVLGVLTGSLRHQARGLRAALRGAGMVAGACGVVYEEYARTARKWRFSRTVAR